MDVALQGGPTTEALERARLTASAVSLELALNSEVIARAGPVQAGPGEVDDLCAGITLRRWGGESLDDRAALELVAAALAATFRAAVTSDDARAAAAVFLGATTHEVKTPLTVVLGTLRLLQQHIDAVDVDQRDMLLGMAARRTRDVARLVDGVLHTARSQLTPDVPRRSVLSDVIEDAKSGVEFGADVRVAALPDVVLAIDPATGRSVLGNLLDDALTRGGQVHLAAAVEDDEVVVKVRNTDRPLLDLQTDDAFEPAAPHADTPSATAGLHLAALLCEAGDAELVGGVAASEASFEVRFPLSDG